jgi:hypothetical protein
MIEYATEEDVAKLWVILRANDRRSDLVAKLLGVSRHTVERFIGRHGIQSAKLKAVREAIQRHSCSVGVSAGVSGQPVDIIKQ